MQRRELRFSTFEEVRTDLLQLEARGYTSVGRWDLSQIANHLADWIAFPIDGFPKSPWFIRVILGVMRTVQGKALYDKFVRNQRMANGQPTIPNTVHTIGEDPREAVGRLSAGMDRLAKYRGPLHSSPLFGELTYDQVVALQLAHCAHHLSFLVPKS